MLIDRLGLMGCKTAPWTKQVWLALISFSSPVFQHHPLPLVQPSSSSVCQDPCLTLRHHKGVSLSQSHLCFTLNQQTNPSLPLLPLQGHERQRSPCGAAGAVPFPDIPDGQNKAQTMLTFPSVHTLCVCAHTGTETPNYIL